GLEPVVVAFGVSAPVGGSPVADRRVPVLADPGQAPEPTVDQGNDAGRVQHLADPRNLQQFVLVAAAGPATIAPQQVAMQRGDRDALRGVGTALGVVQDLLVAPPRGSVNRRGGPG